MALRLAMSLDRYQYTRCPQHVQANGEVRGASRIAGEASSAEGATSTVVLGTQED